MSTQTELRGQCLCGKIAVTATPAENSVGACHCAMCRSWGGGPFMTIDCGTDVSFTGEEDIGTFDSSQWAERGFCRSCGSHLFYRLKQTGQTMLPASLINPDDTIVFDHQVFIDEKPGYYAFANKTEDWTGAEVFAKFGGESDSGE